MNTNCSCSRPTICNKDIKLENCVCPMDNGNINICGIKAPCSVDGTIPTAENNWQELSINGTVFVPSEKPSIEELDTLSVKIEIIQQKIIATPNSYNIKNEEGKLVTGRKLLIEGLICVGAYYVSKLADQGYHSFHGQIPFSAFIVLPSETSLTALYHISPTLEDVIIKKICDRTIELTSTFLLVAIPLNKAEDEICFQECGLIPTGIDNCKCIHCEDLETIITGVTNCSSISLTDNTTWSEILIPEILNIPISKPDVEKIISLDSKIELLCLKIIETPNSKNITNQGGLKITGKKLVVEALLKQKIVYVAANCEHSVHAAHFDVPISAYIVLPSSANTCDKYILTSCIEDIFICTLNCRQIFKNTTIFLKADKYTCPV